MKFKVHLNIKKIFSLDVGSPLYIPAEVRNFIRSAHKECEKETPLSGSEKNKHHTIIYDVKLKKILRLSGSGALPLSTLKSKNIASKGEETEEIGIFVEKIKFKMNGKQLVSAIAMLDFKGLSNEEAVKKSVFLFKKFSNKEINIYEVKNLLDKVPEEDWDESCNFESLLDFLKGGEYKTDIKSILCINNQPNLVLEANIDKPEENTLLISYFDGISSNLNKYFKPPKVNGVQINKVFIKFNGKDYFIKKCDLYYKEVFINAELSSEEKILIGYNSQSINFIKKNRNNNSKNTFGFDLGIKSINMLELEIKYKPNVWPITVESVEVSGPVDYFKYSSLESIKESERKKQELIDSFKNMSAENALYAVYLLDYHPARVRRIMKELFEDEISKLYKMNDEQMDIMEMNYDWIREQRNLLPSVIKMYEEIIKSLSNTDLEIGSRRYKKKMRKIASDLSFQVC